MPDINKPADQKVTGISYFFPAHNEEANVEPMVRRAQEFLPTVVENFEIIVVNDGSSDRTQEIAESLAAQDARVRVVTHPHNLGYGAALKSGIRAATFPWVLFTDGDRQFDLGELPKLIALADAGADAAIGYRIARKDPWHRALNAFMYKQLIRLLFGLKVRDIDCAFKLMRTELVQSLGLKSDGALLSAEMLIRISRRGGVIRQAGVHHFPRPAGEQSGAKLSVIIRMFRELFALAGTLRREGGA